MQKILFSLLVLSWTALSTLAARRPNFVWYMAEDISVHTLRLYNPPAAPAPHLEKLAREGLVFQNAYCNAPVCSAARSTLFTGLYAPRVGISFHRKLADFKLPQGYRLFPDYLRRNGYWTVNARKTDYNFTEGESAWDIVRGKPGDWRKRKDPSQPFFFVQTFVKTHESCLHFREERMKKKEVSFDPSKVELYPFHPDTPCFRFTYATLYDRIAESDREFGRLVEMLRKDQLLDDTFIFFIGDNGGCQAGTKSYTGETGLHVPLVVSIPKNWRHLVPFPAGEQVNGLVSFMDLAPTLLRLAECEIPEEFDGTPFLGEGLTREAVEARNTVFSYGDRFDNQYAFNRVVNRGHFKYSRNYFPYLPKILPHFYRDRQLAVAEWTRLFREEKLNSAQRRLFEPQGTEELYDLSNDPYELHNLAKDGRYAKQLADMRKTLTENILRRGDLGFLPEGEWLERGNGDPGSYCQRQRARIARAVACLDLQLLPFAEARSRLEQALASADPVDRYWGSVVCISFGKNAEVLRPVFHGLLADSSLRVRSKAALFLTLLGEEKHAGIFRDAFRHSTSSADRLLILNDLLYLKTKGAFSDVNFSADELRAKGENEIELVKSIGACSHP